MNNLDFLNPTLTPSDSPANKINQLAIIGTLLVASVVITNVIGTKIMTLFNFNFTAGVITYASVFLFTDIIGEVWGKRQAYFFVYLGFVANILLLLFVNLAIDSPPASFWEGNQTAYAQTLGSVWRIVLASMAAYLVSQLHDVWAFDFWKKQVKGKFSLAFRNNISTITSQTIDTLIFITIAFYNIVTIDQLFTMIVGQLAIKIGLAVLDTPFIYGLRWFLTRNDSKNLSEKEVEA